MEYLIFRLIEKDELEFLIECDNLSREDATEKEKAVAELIEESVKNLLEYLNDNKMIDIKYIKDIK
jgi:hypothetical protein